MIYTTIKSKKSFYPLERPNLGEFWQELPIREMLWYLVGAPAERSTSEGTFGTRNHILGAKHLLGEATYTKRDIRGDFDFVTLELIAGKHSYPLDYGGVSGGGAWLLPLMMNPDVGVSTMTYEAPILAAVPFYQRAVMDDACEIVCHGPESIYARVCAKLKELS